jgi:DNA-binding beta-propeller fold protein YncE
MPVLASFLRRAPLLAGAVAVATLTGACIYTSDAVLLPPAREFYFPTGLVVSPGGTTLYVINSDFDLQYNGGTIQALALAELRPDLLRLTSAFKKGDDAKTACATVGVLPNGKCELAPPFICTNDILNPGPCSPIVGTDARPLVKNFATIGAFATGAIFVRDTDPTKTKAPARLFVPVRGDPSITFLDVDDDTDSKNVIHACKSDFCLECAQEGTDRRCANSHKIGEDPFDNTRVLTLPTEPVGIAASEDGHALVAAHDTEASVSLSSNVWGGAPSLQYVLTGLPTGPTEVVTVPMPGYVRARVAHLQKANATALPPFDYQPGFLITYRAAPELDLLRFSSDSASAPARPFLTKVAGFAVTTNQDGKDSRGVAIDSSERDACEAKCPGYLDTPSDCLLDCAKKNDLRVFIANRAPATLILGRVTTTPVLSDDQGATRATSVTDDVQLFDTVPLDTGPSHVAIGKVIDKSGNLVTRVFAVCFDTRFVFMYDPINNVVEATFRTGRGPQAMAFDTAADASHSFLFVAHFTDSYLGVIDLDERNPTFGSMFATLGEPLPPRESK